MWGMSSSSSYRVGVKNCKISESVPVLEIAKLSPARGPKRAGPCPGLKIQPPGLTGRNWPNDFLFKIPLCIVSWPWVVTRKLYIVVTCKCVVY